MLQLRTSRPWFLSRSPRFNPIYPSNRKSMSCLRWWNQPSALSSRKWEVNSQTTRAKLDYATILSISENLNDKILKMDLKNHSQHVQGPQTKLTIAYLSSYFLVTLIQQNSGNTVFNMVQDLFFHVIRTFVLASFPFACISNSLNKPTPLQLDVSFPSLQDIRWNFSRLLYLFNIQLEKNVATFLVVLLAACFSFVMIGGFLFYKFRGSTQSLEDCFWEAWACLCSSSTHLRQRTRVERVIGFVLAICVTPPK